MIGGGSHRHLLSPPGKNRDLFRRLGVAHQADIRPIGSHRLVHFFRTKVLHLNAGLRITSNKFFFQARQFREANRINRSHPDGAFHFTLQHVERYLKFVAPVQDIAAHIEIELAGFGYDERTVATIQQGRTHLLLQILQVLAYSRLANPIQRSALTDASAVCHIFEKLEAIEIHTAFIVLEILIECQLKFCISNIARS